MNGVDTHCKSVNEWASRQDLEEGYTIANAKYIRDYAYFRQELKHYSAILYVLGVELKNHYLTKMMYSAKKQSAYCGAVCAALKRNKVCKEHYAIFERDVKMLYRRLDTIERITKEDLHLTEFEPFFNNVIGDLDAFDGEYDELAQMAREWNAEHQEEIAKHMEEIKPELERHNAFIEKNAEARKRERLERRAERKAENEYVKEIKENEKRHKAEYKKLERSFQRYYEGKW